MFSHGILLAQAGFGWIDDPVVDKKDFCSHIKKAILVAVTPLALSSFFKI